MRTPRAAVTAAVTAAVAACPRHGAGAPFWASPCVLGGVSRGPPRLVPPPLAGWSGRPQQNKQERRRFLKPRPSEQRARSLLTASPAACRRPVSSPAACRLALLFVCFVWLRGVSRWTRPSGMCHARHRGTTACAPPTLSRHQQALPAAFATSRARPFICSVLRTPYF